MDYDTILLDAEERMEKACAVLREKFRGMRTGRASPGLVEGVRVDYYGSPTPLKQLANVSAPEADLLVIKPFDPSVLGEIEKALMKSDVGIHPSNDGKVIRLQVPPLSQERRQQLATRAKETAEESRVAVRNIRRDANKSADDIKKSTSEDDVKSLKEEVQELVKTFEKSIDEILKQKTEELTNF
ncbi:MAG: ribosome recycling factor [Planctomycetes bacterium]|nr:ribosome recycling factor [Planctomycetota bacterium]